MNGLSDAEITAPIATRAVLEQARSPLPVNPKARAKEGDRRLRAATSSTLVQLKEYSPECDCDPAEAMAFVERVASAVLLIYKALREAGVIGADGAA